MDDSLHRLARHHGLTLGYDDPFTGAPRPVPDATLRLILEGLGIDPDAPPSGPGATRRMEVPKDGRVWLPDDLFETPGWGLFCQLYELRSERNWGIGDFADLAEVARIAGARGADFLGVNPVHALFLAAPNRRSPFFPSNRRFLNPLYIAPDRLGATELPDIDDLRGTDLVDYPAVARAKLAALKEVFRHDASDSELDAFTAQGGEALRLHAAFEAISARMVAEGHGAGWTDWPEALQDPAGEAAAALMAETQDDIRFHLWLQLIARTQLAEAARAATDAGMRIGLYLDLAVGEAPDGSATWSGAAAALPDLTVGAPPDMFASKGQNWSLAAPSPTAMKAADYAPFREMIAAQMRDAGALRIDHVMALWQLFLIPEGQTPAEGTHLRFPMGDLLRELALLSHDHRAIVIGEDLGFVPKGLRAAMARANILSYRILVFEQTERGFKGATRYPEKALACISTHDLPVLSSWWKGEDVERRREFGLVDEPNSDRDARHRATERASMLRAFRRAKALTGRVDANAEEMPDAVLDAAHAFLARTPCCLVGVRLADLVGPVAPTNLPGTTDEYPNWSPKSPTPIDQIEDHETFTRITDLMRRERPRPRSVR